MENKGNGIDQSRYSPDYWESNAFDKLTRPYIS